MNVIVATWYDDMNVPFLQEFYKSSVNVPEIFNFYRTQKAIYQKSVIASYGDTLVFSDGTRVILELHPIKSAVNEEEFINLLTV